MSFFTSCHQFSADFPPCAGSCIIPDEIPPRICAAVLQGTCSGQFHKMLFLFTEGFAANMNLLLSSSGPGSHFTLMDTDIPAMRARHPASSSSAGMHFCAPPFLWPAHSAAQQQLSWYPFGSPCIPVQVPAAGSRCCSSPGVHFCAPPSLLQAHSAAALLRCILGCLHPCCRLTPGRSQCSPTAAPQGPGVPECGSRRARQPPCLQHCHAIVLEPRRWGRYLNWFVFTEGPGCLQ